MAIGKGHMTLRA